MQDSTGVPDQQAVYEVMRARLNELFGPGGSFRITLGRATLDDAVFTDTVADTVAWEVAGALENYTATSVAEPAGKHSDPDPVAEHEALWRHIEEELLIRRTGPDSVAVDVDREVSVASRFRSRNAA
ncbi:hypothetical protein BH10ACT7_BH10ACT7_10480 [soil metagenome]